MDDLSALAEYVGGFWKNEAIGAGSPLYAALCDVVASSEPLLKLAAQSQPGQPAPNMLFAAVHATLADHPDDSLTSYYPSFGGSREPDAHLGTSFEGFCLRWSGAIAEILRSRLVQTNEVRRSAFLLPALSFAWRDGGRRPLALIEMGPSAGLNLLFDRYHYDYGGVVTAGDPGSTVRIDAGVRGVLTNSEVEMPVIARRTGIDLNPLDVRDPADAAWLTALTFPEHNDRRKLLAAAIDVVRTADVTLVKGDAVKRMPREFADLDESVAPCVVASFVLHQLDPEQRLAFRAMLEAESLRRPFYVVAAGYSDFLNWDGNQPDASTFVKVAHFDAGTARVRTLIHCHPHCRWLEYLHRSTWESVR